jgi:hypothetical protein
MKLISKSTFMKMRNEYDKTFHKISSEKLKKEFPVKPQIEDTALAWISRKELEQLLNDNKPNGLKIYYESHHESTNSNPGKDYKGLHNIILVATKKEDMNPKNPPFENSKDQLRDEELKPQESNTSIENYAGAGEDLFPLCPPHRPK